MKFVKAFLNLVRWKNLLIIIYVQVLIKFLLFQSFNVSTKLTVFQFFLLLFALVFISAAGYIINDIFDIKADLINKPRKVIVSKIISIERAKSWYLITNVFGIVLGIIFSLNTQEPRFAFIFILTPLLLYFYSTNFKHRPLIGNLIIAALIGFCIFLLALIDLGFYKKSESEFILFSVISLISIFAFLINFAREILKDIEDIKGDFSVNSKTLPIILGSNRTKKIGTIVLAILLFFLFYIVIKFSKEFQLTTLYLLFFVIMPLFYTMLKLRRCHLSKEYRKINSLLKLVMFFGSSALIIFSLSN